MSTKFAAELARVTEEVTGGNIALLSDMEINAVAGGRLLVASREQVK